MTRFLRGAAKATLFVALVAAGLVLVEMAARVAILRGRGAPVLRRPPAERMHTRYDPELGWVNVPSTARADFYGPGRALHINAQGFRGTQDTPERAAHRIVCSGDSFTLGYGVSDDETWCAELATLSPGLETVNMGQGGYGIDQAYLWYRRDGLALDHDLQILAFVHDDFVRMTSDHFLRYGKPVLRVRDGGLAVENVPVPRTAYLQPWITQNLDLLTSLYTFEVLRRIAQAWAPAPSPPSTDVAAVALRVFEELRALHRARGSRLLLVYLPMRADGAAGPADGWRSYLAAQLARREIPFLDLVPELRRVGAAERETLFIPAGAIDFPGAEGHYTAAGNRFVATRLLEALRHDPLTASQLGLAP
jgi:hypothetical protein